MVMFMCRILFLLEAYILGYSPCCVDVVGNMELINVNKECLYWHNIHTKHHESYSQEYRIRGIMAVVMKSSVLWGVILCSPVKVK